MGNNTLPLHLLPVGKMAKVMEMDLDGSVRRRMLDLGIVNGTKVVSLFQSPSGNPVAYLIRGAVIALRSDVSSRITVLEC